MKKVIWAVPLLLFLGIILILSVSDAETSTKQTIWVIEKLSLTNGLDRVEDRVEYSQLISKTRKQAHFGMYFFLSLITFATFLRFTKKIWKASLYSIIFCLIIGACDEIVQRYIPGRGSEFSDLAIDMTGAVIGIFIFTIIALLLKHTFKELFNSYIR